MKTVWLRQINREWPLSLCKRMQLPEQNKATKIFFVKQFSSDDRKYKLYRAYYFGQRVVRPFASEGFCNSPKNWDLNHHITTIFFKVLAVRMVIISLIPVLAVFSTSLL